jgi:hypothetical protein
VHKTETVLNFFVCSLSNRDASPSTSLHYNLSESCNTLPSPPITLLRKKASLQCVLFVSPAVTAVHSCHVFGFLKTFLFTAGDCGLQIQPDDLISRRDNRIGLLCKRMEELRQQRAQSLSISRRDGKM